MVPSRMLVRVQRSRSFQMFASLHTIAPVTKISGLPWRIALFFQSFLYHFKCFLIWTQQASTNRSVTGSRQPLLSLILPNPPQEMSTAAISAFPTCLLLLQYPPHEPCQMEDQPLPTNTCMIVPGWMMLGHLSKMANFISAALSCPRPSSRWSLLPRRVDGSAGCVMMLMVGCSSV